MTLALLFLLLSSATEAYERANAHFKKQEFREAAAALEQALRLDPKLVPALTLKAKLAMGFNQFDVARDCVLRAVELAPESQYVQFLLGFYYYVENDFVKALPPLEKARRLNPSDPRAAFYLAMSYEGLARAQEAIRLYEIALDLESKQGNPLAETHIAYARLLFTLGRFEESEQWIDKAVQIDPQSRDAHYEKGRLFFERGQYEKAVEHGARALAAASPGTTDAQVHFLLGRAYLKLGRKELAEEHLSKFRAAGATLRR